MRKSSVLLLLSFLLIAGYAIETVMGQSGGIIGQSRVGCSGGGCHGQQSTQTVVTIWADSAQFTLGHTYLLHISVANPTERAGGCDITCDNSAKFATSGSGLQIYQNELTHTAPRAFTGDSAVWTFKYTPTKIGTAHIYAAGNAVNLNGNADFNDHWNTLTYTMTVVAPSGARAILPTLFRDTVLVGGSVQGTIMVHNTGTSALSIDRYKLRLGNAWGIVDSSARSLAVGDSAPIVVRFSPSVKSTYTDSLYIYSNDAVANPEVMALIGVGTQGITNFSNTVLNFDAVPTGSSKMLPLAIANKGNAPLVISNITISTPSGAFTSAAFINGSELPITLNPSSVARDTFAFAPIVQGYDTAVVKFTVKESATAHDTAILLVGQGAPAAAVLQSAAGSDLGLYPNPASARLEIRSLPIGAASVKLIDQAGRIIVTAEKTAGRDLELGLGSVPNGSYFLRIEPQSGEPIIRRIVVEH